MKHLYGGQKTARNGNGSARFSLEISKLAPNPTQGSVWRELVHPNFPDPAGPGCSRCAPHPLPVPRAGNLPRPGRLAPPPLPSPGAATQVAAGTSGSPASRPTARRQDRHLPTNSPPSRCAGVGTARHGAAAREGWAGPGRERGGGGCV